MDERVRARLLAESRGNPLALLELSQRLSPADLAGGFGLADARPLAGRIEHRFLELVQSLPRDTQMLLLTAAADPVGDTNLLWRAAGELGIGSDAAGPAETAGLLALGLRVDFRHPLVRSAIYSGAPAADRRAVHRALAESTDPVVDPDRRAWHRAHATASTDEAVAGEMVRSAGRAQRRGGLAAAAAFLQRATELTPDPEVRAERALAAAQAKLDAGDPAAASDLLLAAELARVDEHQAARLARLKAQIAFALRRGSDAPPLFLDAARRLAAFDPATARETYLDALAAAMFAGRLSVGPGVREIAAEAAAAAPPAPQPASAADALLDALLTRFTDGYAAAAAPLSQARAGVCRAGEQPLDVARVPARAGPLGRRALVRARDQRRARRAPDRGAEPAPAGGDLSRRAARARRGVRRGVGADRRVAGDHAGGRDGVVQVRLADARGVARRPRAGDRHVRVRAARRDGARRGDGPGDARAGRRRCSTTAAAAMREALEAARRACEHDDVGMFSWALVELVEAAVRADRPDDAAGALACLISADAGERHQLGARRRGGRASARA